MPRYFLEVGYNGSRYAGFQVQQNANTIQAEVEKVLAIIFRETFSLTGSSRTDAGVHARQNFFHFDTNLTIDDRRIYNLNALLPPDIVIKKIFPVAAEAHCRFDAVSREYRYVVYGIKDPFLYKRAFYYPYPLDIDKLNELAAIILAYSDFTSFSKKNTQVKSFLCNILHSRWHNEGETLVYTIRGNRFLRGMVRALVATMLQVSREPGHTEKFRKVIEAEDCSKADFSADACGLMLAAVEFENGLRR